MTKKTNHHSTVNCQDAILLDCLMPTINYSIELKIKNNFSMSSNYHL